MRQSAWLAVLAVSSLAVLACNGAPPEPPAENRPAATAEPETPEPPDVVKEDLTEGTGAVAKDGDKVKVNYTGKLAKTNFVFDTSIGPGKKPFEFTIGKPGVIKGWNDGVPGMKVGGKRKLTIPSRLAYGDKGQPPKIPGKATLIFEIELLSIENPDAAASASASASADAPPKKKKKKK